MIHNLCKSDKYFLYEIGLIIRYYILIKIRYQKYDKLIKTILSFIYIIQSNINPDKIQSEKKVV